jgi:hypothetical protein
MSTRGAVKHVKVQRRPFMLVLGSAVPSLTNDKNSLFHSSCHCCDSIQCKNKGHKPHLAYPATHFSWSSGIDVVIQWGSKNNF